MTAEREPQLPSLDPLDQLSVDIRNGLVEQLTPYVRAFTARDTQQSERIGYFHDILVQLRNTSNRAFNSPEARDAFMYRILTGEPIPSGPYTEIDITETAAQVTALNAPD